MSDSYQHEETVRLNHRLLTMSEAAEHLNVSTKTVQRLIRDGYLQAKHIGRCVRISPAALESYINERAECFR